MPNFDKTGPMGYGPLSGRGIGPCCCYGYGRRGGGVMQRRFFTKKEEKALLQEEVDNLKQELEAAKELLSQIEDQE